MIRSTLAALAIATMFAGPAMAINMEEDSSTARIMCVPTGEDIWVCFPIPFAV